MAGKAEGMAVFVYLATDRLYPRGNMGKTLIIFTEILSAKRLLNI